MYIRVGLIRNSTTWVTPTSESLMSNDPNASPVPGSTGSADSVGADNSTTLARHSARPTRNNVMIDPLVLIGRPHPASGSPAASVNARAAVRIWQVVAGFVFTQHTALLVAAW